MGGRWDEPEVPETPTSSNDTTSHKSRFKPGTPKPLGQPYSKMVIVPQTLHLNESTTWLTDIFKPGGDVNTAIYVTDDPKASLRPPKNKGHEVMVYLTYIIDNYDTLADVNIFMHAHRQAWHNAELLGHDAVLMISRLSADRVQREGYMNLRCQWEPGCPDWMHPGSTEQNINKQEQTQLARSWTELFPSDPVPQTLAQPCCAQFAVSRDRILSLPKGQYVYYRDWLLSTPLNDFISGRVWEYLWHFVFTGQNVHCPKEHVCYCDGFGVCFGGEEQYDEWWSKMYEKRALDERLKVSQDNQDRLKQEKELGTTGKEEILEPSQKKELVEKIAVMEEWLDSKLREAKEKGNHPENRAKEAGVEI